MKRSSLHPMESLGLKEPLGHQCLSMESPTEMDSSWRWVGEPSSLRPMEPLGLKEPLEHQNGYMESPTPNNPPLQMKPLLPQHFYNSISVTPYQWRCFTTHFFSSTQSSQILFLIGQPSNLGQTSTHFWTFTGAWNTWGGGDVSLPWMVYTRNPMSTIKAITWNEI